MIDLDASRTVDIESLKLQYADKFASYTPKDKPALTQIANTNNALPDGRQRKYKLEIYPPLLNSSSPWATTVEDLAELYACEYTGAVTTRTSLLEGFNHDDSIHQHIFFPAGSSSVSPAAPKSDASALPKFMPSDASTSSLNTYGYSPHTLSEYLGFINEIVGQRHLGTSTIRKKPFIISVTGTPDEIAMSYALLANAAEMDEDLRLAMEVNLSCPNIGGAPPPAYDGGMLGEYLEAIGDSKSTYRGRMDGESVPRVGVKLPPYTWKGQFEMVTSALRSAKSSEPNEGSIIDFITCTNTLGSSLVLDSNLSPALNSETGTGIGGLAGAALHPLALGNVATFRKMLDEHEDTENIMIIGVGGVEDQSGFARMRKVGAEAVGVATSLGRFGVGVFEKITKGVPRGEVGSVVKEAGAEAEVGS